MKVENARLDTTGYTVNTDDTLVLTEVIAVLLEYLILIVCNSVGVFETSFLWRICVPQWWTRGTAPAFSLCQET